MITQNTRTRGRLLSVGAMCERLQRSPADIERAADELGIAPTLMLNEQRFYRVADETMIARRLRERGQRIETRSK